MLKIHTNFALMLIAVMFMGCSQDYGVVNERVETIIETEYVEVETEVVVEIPVVIKEEVEIEADPGEVWVDSFVQPLSVNGVDILWVIDTSGSMNRFNSQLLASLETMNTLSIIHILQHGCAQMPLCWWYLYPMKKSKAQQATPMLVTILHGTRNNDLPAYSCLVLYS